MNRFFVTTCFVFLSVVCIGESYADIAINGFTDATNDRFTNSSSFIGNGLDFSGVGRSINVAGTNNRWGTLISNNVIISAAHWTPSGEIAFYEDNDPTKSPVLRNIVAGAGQQIGNSDIYLTVLDAPVSSNIKIFDFADEFLSAEPFDENTNSGLQAGGSFDGEIAYMFGISPSVRSDTRIDQAVGRNRISGYIEDIPFASNTNNDSLLLIREDNGDPDYVQYEAQFRGGDSGAPLFIERDGDLLLVGVNSFINAADTTPVFSGVTYVGNYTDEINAFIAANAVPEPGSASIILLAMTAFCSVRRRTK
jgi:V8-like Glu-specific endopeptidase